ncbi:MAG: hypothetical protein HIU82_19435 [Proteobacteria bacterium]|nr:hypothetical protein [Pseudomonadota bacterium]
MIRRGFLDSGSRKDLTELARDGSAAHRLARRANTLVRRDDGMICEAIAKVLLLDDDTVRTGVLPLKCLLISGTSRPLKTKSQYPDAG